MSKKVLEAWELVEAILSKLKEKSVGNVNYRHIDELVGLPKGASRDLVRRNTKASIHYQRLEAFYKSLKK